MTKDRLPRNEYGVPPIEGQVKPPQSGFLWSWKALEYSLVIGAFLLAFGIWFIPNWSQSPEMKALERAVNERKAARLAYEAREAEKAKYAEEMGLVYLPIPSHLQDKAKEQGVELNPDGTPKTP